MPDSFWELRQALADDLRFWNMMVLLSALEVFCGIVLFTDTLDLDSFWTLWSGFVVVLVTAPFLWGALKRSSEYKQLWDEYYG